MPSWDGRSPWSGLGLWLDPPVAPAERGALPGAVSTLARSLESNGFEWLLLSDPTNDDPPAPGVARAGRSPSATSACEPFTLAGAVAALTDRLRLGIVPGPDRSPSMMAKFTTTLDVLSHGRAGLTVRLEPSPSTMSTARTLDALRVYRSMLEDEFPTHAGRFYRIDGAINRPGPVRSEGIPVVLIVGGAASLPDEVASTLYPMVDAVVVVADDRSTSKRAVRLRDMGRDVDPGRNHVPLIWATPPVPAQQVELAELADRARDQRAAGADAVLVRVAGLPSPALVTELAAQLNETSAGS